MMHLITFCVLLIATTGKLAFVQAWSARCPPVSSANGASPAGRRHVLQRAVLGTAAVLSSATVRPPPASASPVSSTSLERLRLGHARIKYLLDNWNSITEVCGTTIMSDTERKQVMRTEGGGKCLKTPLRVQEFMGYKDVNDPLYRIDKFLIQSSVGDMVDDKDMEAYMDSVERYKETADQTALLAYTSSWGEANPNGSKEVIDDYLEQTKVQVVESERLLRNVLGYLHLDPLPPLKNGKL